MTPEELFTAALGLGRQWRVAECRFEGEPKRLELRLEHVPGEHFECPQCKALCGVHDTLERRWRHLNFFQYRCELVAKVPRTWCRKDGVHQVQAPWAREGSGFTLLMEALVMLLSAQMPVDGIADLLQENDTRLWRVLIHYVEQAQARRDWKAVRRIAVDETSARRGHRYVTNVLDCDGAGLLLMVEGRSSEALGCFAQALREHGGEPTQIQAIAMDMSPAYLKGAAEYFPQAQIIFEPVPCDAACRSGARDGTPPTSKRRSRAQRFTLEFAWQRLESERRTPEASTRSLFAVHQTWAGNDFARDAASYLRQPRSSHRREPTAMVV